MRQGLLGSLGIHAYVIDAPQLYVRAGTPYEDDQRQPHHDNHLRFALLGWVAAQLACGLDPLWQAAVVHSHDWHAALTSAYLAFGPGRGRRVASVYTVHNLAYQGVFAPIHFFDLGLPTHAFSVNGLEFHGQLSFMKAGLYFADHLTTVSPTYAREIQTPEQGCGLDGLLRVRANELSGILNAVDETVWNPANDAAISHNFDAQKPAGKARCKAELQQALGLSVQADAPLFGVVSRLTEQKGLHLVLAVLDELIARGGQLVVLGTGDAALEAAFNARAAANPQSVSVRIGYDEAYAHRVFAATDVTLVPSRFEPCGLTQMYGLKYGSLPLVRRVGGLADTVTDTDLETLDNLSATGFVFNDFHVDDYRRAIRRAFALYHRRSDWNRVRQTGMKIAFDWASAAQHYTNLYKSLI